MANIRKHKTGWRAQVERNGQRRSKVCRTKALATAWADETEKSLAHGLEPHTLGELFARYARTYGKRKRTAVAEGKRGDRLVAALGPDTLLADLTREQLAAWRDAALEARSAAAVRRDWSLLHHVLQVAVTDYQWLKTNPLTGLKRPPRPAARTRTWTGEDLAAFLHCAGHPGETKQARVGDALLFALETGCRAGEITRIRPADVHARHVHIAQSKNGAARDVPLSSAAQALLKKVGGNFNLTDSQLNSLYRKARDRANLVDLHFHDARRTALTRLATRFDALELARISGHKDLRVLLETYYAPRIEDLADKLD